MNILSNPKLATERSGYVYSNSIDDSKLETIQTEICFQKRRHGDGKLSLGTWKCRDKETC